MGRIGATELLLILAIALLLFGPSKLADMGKGLGEGLKNFKKGLSPDDQPKEPPPPPPPAPPPPSDVNKGNPPPAG
jgi:sec-independent protein translocase protein TatA